MFRKRKEIEIKHEKPEPRVGKTAMVQTEIVVKLAPTLEDKMQVLNDFYLWLFDNNYDANSAAVLTKYKQDLQRKDGV